jgi:tetratricopeptide (TPR) repeat protein
VITSASIETIPDRGSLEDLPLPLLLLRLYRRRYSGSLSVSREGVEKRVFLREGVPVMAESNRPSESLGVQLMDAGRITRDDYARVVETVRTRRCKEGAALLGLQLVEPRELYEALKQQVRLRLLDCLAWSRGSFALEAGASPVDDATDFRCDPIPLVQEAVAVHWGPAVLRAQLSAKLDAYASATPRTEALASRLYRDAEVDAFVAGLGSEASLGAQLDALYAPTAIAAAWVLDALGALVFRSRPASHSADGDPDPNGEPEIEVFVRGAGEPRTEAPGPLARGQAKTAATVNSKLEALRNEILALHQSLDERDHYQLLGIARNADAAAVRRAYVSAAKRFHPDALARLGLLDLREVAEVVFARIATAHETLADPQSRSDYDRAGEGAQDFDAARVVQAEALFRRAEILLRAGNFGGALEFLRPAVAMWPDECAYQSAIGWALYKKAPPDPKSAREHLERAITLDRNDAVATFRLSVVLRSLGENDAAEAAMARAKRLDPKVRA